MKTSIKQFLADLYEIDPSLKAHEAELIPLIEELIANDPSTAPDDAFVQKLRMQLNSHAALIDAEPTGSVWDRFKYLFGGLATVAVIIPVAVILTNQQPLAPGAPLFTNSVEATGQNAFGSLKDIAAANAPLGSPDARSARPQSGGGGPGIGGGGAVENAVAPYAIEGDMRIMPWPATVYDYVYSGSIADLQSTVSVYKREFKTSTVPMSTIANSLNLGGVNLGSFNGMNVDNVSFTQRTPYGYQIYVNLRDGSINIDANYEQWPMSQCQTESCWKQQQVKMSDILSDDQLVAIAEAFAKDHGIDLSIYGDPVVDGQWKIQYDMTADKSLAYIPDQQRVIFPQLIDGKTVYDQSGLPTGLSVSVHTKEKKVMNVYGIADHSYLKSDYAGVTDEAAIKKYLSTIDNYFGTTPPAEAKKVTVTLGTPTVSYAMYYRYTNQRNDELLIPSLVFPVEKVEGGDTTQNMYYRTQVVVPLSQEMLEEMSKRPDAIPLMMREGDAGEGQAVDE